MEFTGSENAIPGSPVSPNPAGTADFDPLPAAPQMNPAGLAGPSVPAEAFGKAPASLPESTGVLNLTSLDPALAPVGDQSAVAPSFAVPSSPASEEFSSPTHLAISREGVHPTEERVPAANAGRPPVSGFPTAWALEALEQPPATEPAAKFAPKANAERELLARPFPEAGPGLEPTAAADAPSLSSFSDPVRPGSYFPVPMDSDAGVGAAVPAGASAQGPGGDAPAGLAFTARVVPLPAAEASATAADEKIPEAKTEKPDTGRTPAPPVSRFSNDLQKEDSSRPAADRVPGTEAQVSCSLPAGSVKPPAPLTGESGITEPEAAAVRRTAATDGKPDPGPAAASAREIQLQFHQGEQRVDVRLTERSGELRVAVRTPDAQLADALRGGLPALSTRLEQTGFRAETWHPAIFHQSVRSASHPAPSSSDSSDGQNGSQQGRQQPEPRQQKPNPAHGAKSQRKEFRWLMSQLP